MSINTAASNLANTIVSPVRERWRHSIPAAAMADHVVGSFNDVARGLEDLIADSIKDLPATQVAEVRLAIMESMYGWYPRAVSLSDIGKLSESNPADMHEVTDKLKDLHLKPGYGPYQDLFKPVYEQFYRQRKSLRAKLRPLRHRWFVPSFDRALVVSTIDRLTLEDVAEFYNKAYVKKSKDKGGKAKAWTKDTEKAAGNVLEHLKSTVTKHLQSTVDAVDALELLDYMLGAYGDQPTDIRMTAEFTTYFSSSYVPILPVATQALPEVAGPIRPEEGRPGTIAEGFFNFGITDLGEWVAPEEDDKAHAAFVNRTVLPIDVSEDPKEMCSYFLMNLIGLIGMSEGHGGAELRPFAVMFPFTVAASYPMLFAIMKQGFGAQRLELRLKFIEELDKLMTKDSLSATHIAKTVQEKLANSLTYDAHTIRTEARKLRDMHFFKNVDESITKYFERNGTYQAELQKFVPETQFTTSVSSFDDEFPSQVRIEADFPVYNLARSVKSTAAFSSEAVLAHDPMFSAELVVDSVDGSEVLKLLSNFNNDVNRHRMSSTQVVFDLTMESVYRRMYKDAANAVADRRIPVYHFDHKEMMGSITSDIFSQKYSLPVSSGHAVLWQEAEYPASVTRLARTPHNLMKEAHYVRTADQVLKYGSVEGQWAHEVQREETAAVLALSKGIAASYFRGAFPTLVSDIEYTRTFKDIPLYKRESKMKTVFVEWRRDPSLLAFLSHRTVRAYAQDLLSSAALARMDHHTISVQQNVVSEIKEYLQVIVGNTFDTLALDSDVMKRFASFIKGEVSPADEALFRNQDISAIFKLLLGVAFEPAQGVDPLLQLIYIQELLKFCKAYFAKRAEEEASKA